jgi:hypothetical protein
MVAATAAIQTLSRRTFVQVLFGFQSSCIIESFARTLKTSHRREKQKKTWIFVMNIQAPLKKAILKEKNEI